MPIRRLEDTLTATTATIAGEDIAASTIGVKPHIIPGVLYPSYVASGTSNKLLDGSTSHSGAFGTAQSDGRKYYYTNINGSKPIKDPRIGAHFGSQRHKFKSIQLLEQETATHGTNVYSVDGREWIRGEGNAQQVENDASGVKLRLYGNDNRIEIVGYFNDANILFANLGATVSFNVYINGGTVQLNNTAATQSTQPTETLRYVDPSVCFNLSFNSTPTLGINTLRIETTGGDQVYCSGIELITQDTTSTATKSQIQIPSQNVVSYGKKFTVAETKHYNPFAFKTDGTTAWASGAHNGTAWPIGTGSSTNIDTATSLGLAAWVSTNYYYPYNGGRVVKWIASDGTIKTSVNMMPPNARNITSLAVAEKGDDSAGTTSAAVANNTYLPTFTDQAIDNSQAEVAKTFHFREFGNGAANTGTLSGTYADVSMLHTTADAVAYVMDDGLTSMSAKTGIVVSNIGIFPNGANDYVYITFIGTGLSIIRQDSATGSDEHDEYIDGIQVMNGAQTGINSRNIVTVAQNLPYGTHVYAIQRTAVDAYNRCIIETSFHQPKMPPIPEDAVVIADYMLMADHVVQTSSTAGHVSKGVRFCSGSRDHYYDAASAFGANATVETGHGTMGGFAGVSSPSGAVAQAKLPFFGTNFQAHVQVAQTAGFALTIGTTGKTETILQSASGDQADIITLADDQKVTLGSTLAHTTVAAAQYQYMGCCVATPIHSSSHYQSFETPFLHELVGGDRNMEQTNLVVTPDGKRWDEVTRDTSYIGNVVVNCSNDGTDLGGAWADVIWDEYRGSYLGGNKAWAFYNKDWAIAYNQMICLRSGTYEITLNLSSDSSGAGSAAIFFNGTEMSEQYSDNIDRSMLNTTRIFNCVRGDYLKCRGINTHKDVSRRNNLIIKRD